VGDRWRRLSENVHEKRKDISFRPESEVHGGGFIIEGNSIRGRTAKCSIKTRRENGEIIHLVAACATDIMLSDVQFSLRVINDDKVSRIFPGMEGIELSFDRCSL
jgi:hypothetical protein